MKFRFTLATCAALAVVATCYSPQSVLAQKAAVPTTVKIGYFNLALVRASYPEAAGSETLRTNAESVLRKDVEDGNKRLQKAQEDKKPKEEIEKMASQLQIEINAKQQALIQLVQSQAAMATQNIAQAVNAVAKDKGLDMVVDGAGVYAGGDKVVNGGVDITEEVIKRLQPQSIKPSGGSTSGNSSSTNTSTTTSNAGNTTHLATAEKPASKPNKQQ